MKPLINLLVAFSMIFIFCFAAQAEFPPEDTIYVKIWEDDINLGTIYVIVEIKDPLMYCDNVDCPVQDMKVIGKAFGLEHNFIDWRVVTLKRGYLNDTRNWTKRCPSKINKPIEENNLWIWDV